MSEWIGYSRSFVVFFLPLVLLSLAHCHSPSISLSLSLSVALAQFLCLSLSFSLSSSISFSLALSVSLARCPSRSVSLVLSKGLSLTQALSLTLSLCLSLSWSHFSFPLSFHLFLILNLSLHSILLWFDLSLFNVCSFNPALLDLTILHLSYHHMWTSECCSCNSRMCCTTDGLYCTWLLHFNIILPILHWVYALLALLVSCCTAFPCVELVFCAMTLKFNLIKSYRANK